MWTTLLLAAALGAGTYHTQATAARIEGHGRPAKCYRLDPEAAFTVNGPARLRLRLWVDIPRRHRRLRPERLTINLDDHTRHHRLRVRPERRLHYAGTGDEKPSRPTRPIPVRIRRGEHHLIVALPHHRSGCVELLGVRLVAPPAPAAAAPVATAAPTATPAGESAPPPPATPPEPKSPTAPAAPTPAAATATASNAQTPSPTAAAAAKATPPAASATAPQGAVAAASNSGSSQGETTSEEINAYGPAQQPPSAEKSAAASARASRTASAHMLRLGPQVGGLLPQGNLQPSMSVSLLVDMPLAMVGIPADFHLGSVGVTTSLYGTGGWTPLRQQDNVMIQGPGAKQTGSTKLIQNTTVIPFELGLRTTLELHGFIDPYVNVGLAMDVVRTQLRIFSLPAQQYNHFDLGVAVGVGGLIPAGPGDVTVEVRYREVGTKLGSLSKVAETALGNASLQLGYVFAI